MTEPSDQYVQVRGLVERYARPMLAVYWVALLLSTHWPNLQVEVSGHSIGELKLDKPLHFLMFAGLALLLVLARLGGRGASAVRQVGAGIGMALAYATLDESTQGYFARTSALDDWLCNALGIAAVGLASLVAIRNHKAGRPLAVTASRAMLTMGLLFVALMLFTPGLWLGPVLPDVAGRTLPWRHDWAGHVVFTCVLTWLLVAAQPLGQRVGRRTQNTVILVALALSAPAIEYLQSFAGRGVELADVIAHGLGMVVALIVLAAHALGDRSALRGAEQRRREAQAHAEAVEQAAERTADSDPASIATIADENAVPTGTPPTEAHGLASTGPPEVPKPTAPAKPAFVGHALTVSILTLLSRVTGLVRESALAAVLGRGPLADAFVFGFQVPNLFRRLFGEGALTAAFIPIYTDLRRRDRLTAQRLASLCLALLLVVLGVLTVLGQLALGAVLVAGDLPEHANLAVRLTMLMLPYMPLVCVVAMIGAVLQVHGRFAAPAAAPVMLNAVMIAAILVAGRYSLDGEPTTRSVMIVAASVLVAGVAQLVWQLAAMLRVEKLTTELRLHTAEPMRKLLHIFVPTAIGLAVFQINTFLDNVLAMALSAPQDSATLTLFGYTGVYPLDQGSVAALAWAQRLYEFPLGIFGVAIATAIFPALAHAAAQRAATGFGVRVSAVAEAQPSTPPPHASRLERLAAAPTPDPFRDILQQGLRLTVFIGLPASVGLLLVGVPLSRVVYERAQFNLEDSLAVAHILAGYAPAIWAYSMNHVLTRGFYAMGDSRTPLVVSLAMVALNLLLNVSLVWFLGAAGFAWSTAACAMIQCGVLLLIIRRYVEAPVDLGVCLGWLRTLLCTAAMAATLRLFARGFDPALLSRRDVAIQLAVMVAVGAAVFLGCAWLLRAPELRWVRGRRGGG